MKNDSLFRTSMVGGYNKDDVKAYIEKLEKERERLRSCLLYTSGKKCDGSERRLEGDEIRLFLSEETI